MSFPTSPYEGQIFYDPDNEKTYECVYRDALDRMVNLHKESHYWKDISEELDWGIKVTASTWSTEWTVLNL